VSCRDTGNKFITGVVDTAEQLSPVITERISKEKEKKNYIVTERISKEKEMKNYAVQRELAKKKRRKTIL
jgi:hypothetical protein